MRDSKITFRVSDDLLERVDKIDESRSEIMREALRSYLEEGARNTRDTREPARKTGATLDAVLRQMVEETVEETVDRKLTGRERDNVNVTVNMPEGSGGRGRTESAREARAPEAPDRSSVEEEGRKTCHQCGEEVADEHVHCPNCGAKASRRVFCDCGDEIRTDWSFCPSCGRRTPTSHALSNE